MKLWEEHKQQRREKILEAAARLISSGDVDNLSMRRLAKEAQLSVATLYNLYGSKADILFVLLDRTIDEFEAKVEALPEQDPIDRLYSITQSAVDLVTSDETLLRPLIHSSMSVADPMRDPHYAHRLSQRTREAFMAGARLGFFLEPEVAGMVIRQAHLSGMGALRLWAAGELDAKFYRVQALYSITISMLAIARDEHRPRLLERLAHFHRKLEGVFPFTEDRLAATDPNRSTQAASAAKA